jgi:threonyl-tRNA synthetase
MPKRFDLNFINSEGKNEQLVVIHRSSIGALERVMAFLIEHYKGMFPLWLSPVQCIILPVSDKFEKYSRKIYDKLSSNGIRVEIDFSNETLGNKIREATLQKVPYMCIIGGQEEESSKDGTEYISVRTRDGKNIGKVEVDKFLTDLKKEIETKA